VVGIGAAGLATITANGFLAAMLMASRFMASSFSDGPLAG
jgi:hypothetical protein